MYNERAKESFNLLNSISGENIFRIYPHKIFCDTFIKDRCATHNDEFIFYEDDSHLSYQGNKLISGSILDLIKNLNK